MSWGEAVRQAQSLADDPSTRLAARLSDHKHPWSYEWQVLTDLYDLTQNAHPFKKRTPYPRPWRDPRADHYGHTAKTRAEVISILNAHGHKLAN